MQPVFDRTLLRQRRNRCASHYAQANYLFTAAGERLTDRLEDIRRHFPVGVNLGCHDGALTPQLQQRAGTEHVFQLELSPVLAQLAQANGPVAVADEEFLPIAPQSVNLVISNLALHWVNDLPGALIQIRQALKPDGLFLAALLGGDTLFELRRCLMEAELELCGGISPRLSPLTDIRDAGGLLQRAGFGLPAVDRDTLTVSYQNPLQLLKDLRAMGATNVSLNRPRTPLRRAVLLRTLQRYQDLFAESDGRVRATFEILFLTGWAPHESQQQPLKPGSAQTRLASALGAVELSAGEKTGRS
jgi:SAM-dependent methyltransferase